MRKETLEVKTTNVCGTLAMQREKSRVQRDWLIHVVTAEEREASKNAPVTAHCDGYDVG